MIQPTLTFSGIALEVKAHCGAEIRFTKLKIGNGSAEGVNIKALTDLVNPIKTIGIDHMDRDENNVTLVGSGYDNSEIQSDIAWNEVGVYANDPDNGEILYAYINSEDAIEILKSNESGVNIENNLSVMLLISSDISVSAVITSIVYATKQELIEHTTERNPHGVDKEDIGLENIENLVFSDQIPEFETGLNIRNIEEGDTMKNIVSKVWSVINLLTTGTIEVARGGTGVTSISGLKSALGISNIPNYIKTAIAAETLNLNSKEMAQGVTTHWTVNIPTKNGYTPIAAFPKSSGREGVCFCWCYINNSTVNAALLNFGNTATVNPSVTVLYQRNQY